MTGVTETWGFEVVATLGSGAHSTIYAVADRHGQVFALKDVIVSDADDHRFIDQTEREHEVASTLCHEAIRRSFELLRARSWMQTRRVGLRMELVDGQTLETFRRHDLATFCLLFERIARGVAAMHSQGYVHADLKPNNILVTPDLRVKLIDFGQSCPPGTIKERIQGTPDYLAPEQALRKPITPRTDVYNLGAAMFWMLTGRHTNHELGEDADGQYHHLLEQAAGHDRDLPLALVALVLESVRSDPAQRPESMREVADRLNLALLQARREPMPPVSAAAPHRPHRRRHASGVVRRLTRSAASHDSLLFRQPASGNEPAN